MVQMVLCVGQRAHRGGGRFGVGRLGLAAGGGSGGRRCAGVRIQQVDGVHGDVGDVVQVLLGAIDAEEALGGAAFAIPNL